MSPENQGVFQFLKGVTFDVLCLVCELSRQMPNSYFLRLLWLKYPRNEVKNLGLFEIDLIF